MNSQVPVDNDLLSQIQGFVEETPEPAALNPLELVLRLARGRLLQLFSAGAVCAALCIALVLTAIAPVYQSSGLVRVLARESKILYADSDDTRLRLYDAFANAEMSMLRSRPILEEGLRRLQAFDSGELPLPPDVSQYAELFDLRNDKGLVSVSGRAGDGELAMRAVNSLLQAYEAAHRDQLRRQSSIRESELRARTADLSADLASLGDDFLATGGEHDPNSMAAAHIAKTTQLQVIDERIDELNATVDQLSATGVSGADVGDVEIQRATLLDNALANLTFERAQRSARLQTLRARYQPGHRMVRDAQAEFDAIETAIAERLDQIATLGKSGALTGNNGAEDSVDDLIAVRDRLQMRREVIRAEAETLNTSLVRIREIDQERTRVRELLVETERALDEVLVEADNDLAGTVEIVAWGARPTRPAEDKRKPLSMAGAIFGGGAGIVGVLVIGLIRGRLRYSDDLSAVVGPDAVAAVLATEPGQAELRQSALKVRNQLDLAGLPESPVVGVQSLEGSATESRWTDVFATSLADARGQVLYLDSSDLERLPPGNARLEVSHSDATSARVVRPRIDETLASRSVSLSDLQALLREARDRFDATLIRITGPASSPTNLLVRAVLDASVIRTTPNVANRDVRQTTTDRLAQSPGTCLFTFEQAPANDPGLQADVHNHPDQPEQEHPA